MTFTFITAAFYLVGVASFLAGYFYLKKAIRKAKEVDITSKRAEEARATLDDKLRETHIQMLRDEMEQRENEALARVATHVQLYYENESLKAKEILDKYIAFVQQEIDSTSQELFQFRNEVEVIQNQLANDTQDMASRLVSIVESERSLFLEKEELNAKTIQLSMEDQEDIMFLLKEIVPRIRRPEVLRKLIWTEYVQKPTTELLNNILPQDCSGIYKITHIPDKKCYIGRSTSVRKRLIEHIKSSLGVGTIADQAVHHAMRDNGLQNFMFELVEECDKAILPEREKFYIETFQSNTHGWNKNIGG